MQLALILYMYFFVCMRFDIYMFWKFAVYIGC